jgi:hypothetical protein
MTRLTGASLVLEVDDGSGEAKRIELACYAPPEGLYAATNTLMTEMHARIRDARTRELTE